MKWYKSFRLNRVRLDLVASEDTNPIFRVIFIDIEWNEPSIEKFETFIEANAVYRYILEHIVGCTLEDCDFNYTPDNYPDEIVL